MVQGEQLTPNLRLTRQLGREGTSHVWQAHHSGLARDVAVKLLGRSLARNSPQLHRFQREAEVAGNIKSPFIAQVLEGGVSSSGVPFLVTELLEGEDLASRITRDGPMSLAEVTRLVAQLVQGLGKAHLLGLVHRNLTPANIFLTTAADGTLDIKVLDVGLSNRSDAAPTGRIPTGAPTDIALPEYSSPEQLFGVKDVDFRADLWSIAVVAYYALTGRVPFRQKNLDGFAKAIETGDFELPSSIVSSLPAAVDGWFVKALQRDPAARFGGARELGEEFSRAAGVDYFERFVRPSVFPAAPGPSSRSSLVSLPDHDIPARNSVSGKQPVTVIGANRKSGTSSALLIAIIAVIGIASMWAGLSLLSP